MKTEKMAEILAGVETKINRYGFWVANRTGIEIEDAKQELRIEAWKSSSRHNAPKDAEALNKWINVDLYFRAKTLVDRAYKKQMTIDKTLPLVFPLIPTVEEDHADAVIRKVDSEARIATLHPYLQKIIHLSAQGMNQNQIARNLKISPQRVNQWIRGK